MSDKPTSSGAVLEKVGQVVGGAVDSVTNEFGQVAKTVSSQVIPQKPINPEDQDKEQERKAKEEVEIKKIKAELHEMAEKLDQPTKEEIEKRQLEARKQEEEELQIQKAEEEKKEFEPVVLPTSPERGLNFNQPKQPIAVQRASTKRETHRGTSG